MIRLGPLLDTRLQAQKEAEQALAAAAAARGAAQATQASLEGAAAAARGRLTATAYDDRRTVGQALADDRFRARLADDARAAEAAALTHRKGALAAAQADEEAARQALAAARRDREALEQVQERADRERQRVADRRAEDAASDLTAARHSPPVRGK
jgi:hypothetical protein